MWPGSLQVSAQKGTECRHTLLLNILALAYATLLKQLLLKGLYDADLQATDCEGCASRTEGGFSVSRAVCVVFVFCPMGGCGLMTAAATDPSSGLLTVL